MICKIQTIMLKIFSRPSHDSLSPQAVHKFLKKTECFFDDLECGCLRTCDFAQYSYHSSHYKHQNESTSYIAPLYLPFIPYASYPRSPLPPFLHAIDSQVSKFLLPTPPVRRDCVHEISSSCCYRYWPHNRPPVR